MATQRQDQVSIPRAAHLLRVSYNVVYRRLLLGELAGEQRDGRWYVAMSDVQRLLRGRQPEVGSAKGE